MRTGSTAWLFLSFCLSSLPLIATSAITGSGGQPARPVVDAPADEVSPQLETIVGPSAKNASNGLLMAGEFTYSFSGSASTITLDRIDNNSPTRTTGTLQLSAWAMTYRPARGDGVTGYRLANYATLNQLQPRTYYSDIVRSGAYVRPPNGTYWIVLVLGEYNPSGCPGNADGYCLQDSFISFTQVSFGVTLPTNTYTDIWYNPAEAGWGLSITHHPSNISFIAWYTYDAAGRAKWYVVSSCPMVGDSCSGAIYEATGPPLGQSFNPASVSLFPVGTMTLTFSGYGTGLMSYYVRGISGVKSIMRYSF